MKKSLLPLLALLLTACSENSLSGKMISWFGKLEPAKTERLDIEPDSVRNPLAMTILQDKLILMNYGYPYMMTVFDKQTGQYTGDYLRRGQGPGEYLWLQDFGALGDRFYAQDPNKKVVLFGNRNMQVSEVEKPENAMLKTILSICPITPSLFVCAAFMENDKRYAIITDKGEVLSTFGNYPDTDVARKLTNQGRAMAYQVKMKYDPLRKELLVWQVVGEYLACYDMTDVKNPKEKFILNGAQAVLKPDADGNNAASIQGRSSYGIMGAALTDKYIVCLFNGEIMQDGNYPARKLLLFSRAGKPVKGLQLPSAYTSVAADGNRVYLLGNDEETDEYIVDTVKL